VSVTKRRTACRECPYRRTSRPGWLGDGDPVPFVAKTYLGERDMPCHMAIDYTRPDWLTEQLPEADMCAGALIMLNNDLKRPRDPRMAAACDHVTKDVKGDVFSHPGKFLSHHSRCSVSRFEAQHLMLEYVIDHTDYTGDRND
jgi:hypothetical protein